MRGIISFWNIRTYLFLLLVFTLFAIFGYKDAYACDRNAPFFKPIDPNTCRISSCGSGSRWETYVAYAASETDFNNRKYCAQLEYFDSEVNCKLGAPVASNLCPSSCTSHSQCGSGGTCADGNKNADYI